MESYDCHAHTGVNFLPFQSIPYPPKVNFVIRNDEKVGKIANTARFINESTSSLLLSIQKNHASEEEWRYYDVNGWLEIDPEILKDLKNIESTS